jgi:hypothetical protein
MSVIALAAVALADARAGAPEVWLVTYGPGQEVWEQFGHNALWLRDDERDLDHVYSFGYFDLEQPGFHLDFARGIMRYFGAAAPAQREFDYYRGRDRSIRAMRLDLDDEAFARLHRLLHEAIFPVPQYYDYDYFFNNCSTWLRDLLDQVLEGRLAKRMQAGEARLVFRDHVRRFTQDRPALRAGLMLLLGPGIDRARTGWEEAFVPSALARWVGSTRIDGAPLVVEERVIYESKRFHAPERPRVLWAEFLLIGLAWASLILLPSVFAPQRRWPGWIRKVSLGILGLSGLLVLLMWFGTGHGIVAGNRIVLLLNPFWLLLLGRWPPMMRRLLWWLLLASALAGAVLLGSASGPQYRPELVIGLVPVIGALLTVLRLSEPSDRPPPDPAGDRASATGPARG